MQAGNGLGNLSQATIRSVKDKPMAKSMAVGGGGRFEKLERTLKGRMQRHAKGAPHDAGALAAYIGRKKYGKAAMAKMAAAGKK